MQLRVLGQVEALAHNAPLFLGGPKHRAVLRCLALRANTVVSMEELLSALWGRRPPRTGRKMVQNVIADLRDVLAQDDDPEQRTALLTHAPGYLLRIDPGHVDALCFTREIHEGLEFLKHGDQEHGVQSLRAALERWPTAVPTTGSPEQQELWRLHERAAYGLAVASAEAQGVVLLMTTETEPTSESDVDHLVRRAAAVIAVLRDGITRHGGAVYTEFGSLIAAVFLDHPDRSGVPGLNRAITALEVIRARLAEERATVSAALMSLLSSSGVPRLGLDTLIDEGMWLLVGSPSRPLSPADVA